MCNCKYLMEPGCGRVAQATLSISGWSLWNNPISSLLTPLGPSGTLSKGNELELNSRPKQLLPLLLLAIAIPVPDVIKISKVTKQQPAPFWKHQFPFKSLSLATIGYYSSWMGDCLGIPGAVDKTKALVREIVPSPLSAWSQSDQTISSQCYNFTQKNSNMGF